MVIRIKESRTLTKYASCESKCKFDGRKWNFYQKRNNDKCWCECIKHHICKKYYIWNPATWTCKDVKYLASIINDSLVTCVEIIEETKAVPTNFNEKKITCKTQNVHILLAFLSFTTALLIVVSIYYYLAKYWAN